MQKKAKTIFEKSQIGQGTYTIPYEHDSFGDFQPADELKRKSIISLPEVSELDLMRHFCDLSKKTVGVDNCFYPLGSCTMKYNPKVNELCANLPGFVKTHPLAPEDTVQGNLEIIWELLRCLCDICGMSAGSLVPNAGAQGEFVGVKMIAAYHNSRGDVARKEILIPDSAHGTNPATASMAGFSTKTVRTNAQGHLDIDHLKTLLSEKTAGIMITNPNTLGIFSSNILEVTKLIHQSGGLVFYDGANLNPLLNVVKPGAMGCDVLHINLHKTFSTPHGGGGPGSGPVLCNERLSQFLPAPRIEKQGNKFMVHTKSAHSIGRIASFYGNFSVLVRAYIYIKLHGNFGLRRIAEMSVLNANYLKKQLSGLFTIPYPQPCMHEFVIQADNYLLQNVKVLDIAKRLLDYGVYAPTIYFPLIVKECMLIEPTESESKMTLDRFITILKKIVEEIKSNPKLVQGAPHTLPVGRLDEVRAAKSPILKEWI